MALMCAMLGAMEVHAAPRGAAVPPEPQTPETREAKRQQMERDMTAWLPRLVGRYDLEGVGNFSQLGVYGEITQRSAEGKADCIAIGDGAGVQCVLHATWLEAWGPGGQPIEGGVPFLGPAAILFGFDPNASVIRYLLLTTDGIAEAETGTLHGNTLRFYFETHCESDARFSLTSDSEGNPVSDTLPDNPGNRCRRVMGIYAPPEAKYLTMTVDIEPWSQRVGTWAAHPLTTVSFDMRRPRSAEPGAP
jgi:hypothetical protein